MANTRACTRMGPTPVCPDEKTPPVPGGSVSNIPGDNRANKRAVTIRSVLVNTIFIAFPIKEYTITKTSIWNNTDIFEVWSE